MPERALQRAALAVAMLTSFVTPFMGSAVNIALPGIGAELGMDAVMLTWIASAYILAAVVFLLPFGRLADIHGRKKVFSIGILFFLLGSLGRVIGWNIASVYIGLSLGPPAGGWMVGHFGWRSIFWLNSLLCAVSLGLTLRYLRREWKEAAGEKFDAPGAAAYALSIVALMYGLSSLPARRGYAALAAAAAALFLFIRREGRTRFPLLEVRLLRGNRVFAFSNLAALISYSATFAVGFLLSLYLQYVKGFSPQQAGLVMISQPVMQALFSPVAGRLSDRIEPRLIASAGMALTAAGLALLFFLGPTTGVAYISLSLVVLGIGFGLFSSPNTNAIMGSVERRHYSVASATLATMRMLGQMFSMGMTALVIALFVGHRPIGAENQGGFLGGVHLLLGGFALLSLAGIFASLARGRVHKGVGAAD
ncbi:MAG: Antiseptic resistance protein [bacterium ADurb.Bin431]|nr:MAG: Antiseptic resistance protein [bacterium ADurb.Bin431]